MLLVVNENTARRQREYGSSTTRIRLVDNENTARRNRGKKQTEKTWKRGEGELKSDNSYIL